MGVLEGVGMKGIYGAALERWEPHPEHVEGAWAAIGHGCTYKGRVAHAE